MFALTLIGFREGEGVVQAAGFADKLWKTVQTVLYGRPVLHVDCGGALEIENCRSILQYDAEKLKLDMGELSVTIEGNELVVDTYQKTLITVRGQVFSIHFGYGGVQGG